MHCKSLFTFVGVIAILITMCTGTEDKNTVDATAPGISSTMGSMHPMPPMNFPAFPVFDFSKVLSSYFEQMQAFHQQLANNPNLHSYAFTSKQLDSNAQAESSLSYDAPSIKSMQENILKQNAGAGGGYAQYGAGSGSGYAGGFGGAFTGAFPEGAHGAFASGSIGPGGAYQTAAVYPENSAQPNVVNRFTETGGIPADGKPYFYGVMSSSSSGTSNIDGKVVEHHDAQTVVNDNGKITTYKVKSP